jgi:hypothetical protein
MRLCVITHNAPGCPTRTPPRPRPYPWAHTRIAPCGALHAPSPPPCVVPTHPPPSPPTRAHTGAHACAHAHRSIVPGWSVVMATRGRTSPHAHNAIVESFYNETHRHRRRESILWRVLFVSSTNGSLSTNVRIFARARPMADYTGQNAGVNPPTPPKTHKTFQNFFAN